MLDINVTGDTLLDLFVIRNGIKKNVFFLH